MSWTHGAGGVWLLTAAAGASAVLRLQHHRATRQRTPSLTFAVAGANMGAFFEAGATG